MKNLVAAAFLAILAAATFALVYAYTRPARFQLVSARVRMTYASSPAEDEARVFLVDTLTGRVWTYFTSTNYGGHYTPDKFANVRVDGLHGAEAMRSLRTEIEEIK